MYHYEYRIEVEGRAYYIREGRGILTERDAEHRARELHAAWKARKQSAP